MKPETGERKAEGGRQTTATEDGGRRTGGSETLPLLRPETRNPELSRSRSRTAEGSGRTEAKRFRYSRPETRNPERHLRLGSPRSRHGRSIDRRLRGSRGYGQRMERVPIRVIRAICGQISEVRLRNRATSARVASFAFGSALFALVTVDQLTADYADRADTDRRRAGGTYVTRNRGQVTGDGGRRAEDGRAE